MVSGVVGLQFVRCVIDEPIRAINATLPFLTIARSTCTNIYAAGLRVGSCHLRGQVRLTGRGNEGVIHLGNAQIAGDFRLEDMELINNAGTAIIASGVRVGGSLHLKRVHVTGNGDDGAINLINAHIAGAEFEDVEINNSKGPALNAPGVRVDRSLLLRGGIRITGCRERGAVNLIGAHIAGDIDWTDVEVTNTLGPALAASRLRVSGSLFLRERIRLSGHDEDGVVILAGARVDGWMGCRGQVDIEVDAGGGLVLDLSELVVGTTVSLPPGLVCPARGQGTTCEHKRWVQLEEFSYASLGPRMDWRQWLHLIRCHTLTYHASAYQRLAAVERAAGHDGTVRRILIAQQHDLRRRNPDALSGRLTRLFHWLWGVLAGYGYRSRRTAAALLLVLAVAGLLGWWAGQVPTRPGHHAAERVTASGNPQEAAVSCSTVELIGLGLDRGLPLAMTGMRGRCDLDTASRKGQAFTVAIWAVQLAVWGLATLALAGYSNLIRKPG